MEENRIETPVNVKTAQLTHLQIEMDGGQNCEPVQYVVLGPWGPWSATFLNMI